MTLREYLDARNESQAAFARRIRVSTRTVERILAGKPFRMVIACRIVQATHDLPAPSGESVELEDLVPTDVAA